MNARRESASRLLRRDEAAAYCGMAPKVFERACPVRPISFGDDRRLNRYDVKALDRWIDRLSGIGSDSGISDDEFMARAGNGRRAG